MPTIKNRPREERYREIPASVLDQFENPRPRKVHRLSRYIFGIVILLVVGSVGYLAISGHLLAGDAMDELNVEQLVAEFQNARSSGEEDPAAAGASSETAAAEVSVQISSDPTGANVEIDGERIGTTPLDHVLSPGAYILSLRRSNFAPIDTVLVFVEGGQESFNFNLAAAGNLAEGGNSDASAAQSSGNDRDPAGVAQRDANEPEIASPASREVDRLSGDDAFDTPANAPSTELIVSSHPAGASVLLNGRMIGRTPLATESIEPGSHRLRIVEDEFEPFETRIQIESGETQSVHGELERLMGEISVLVLPWGSIYIDGVLHEANTDVRYVASVPVGERTIVGMHPTLGSVTRQVSVRPGNTTSVVLDLENGN